MNLPARSSMLPSTAITLLVGIFIVDTFTSLDIAIAVLYVAVVLLSAIIWTRYRVMMITALCLALTISAYIISHGLKLSGNSFARCIVSLIAITVTAFLALKNQAATARLLQHEEALHRSQAQLAHVTRVTMLGELAASIAHEVSQPLAAISTNGEASLRWLNRQVPDLDEARAAINNMVSDTRRASEVIQRIRALSRKSEPRYIGLNLNEVVTESAALVQRELKRNGVQLKMTLADDLQPVDADRVQLQQVVINLLVNAMQAMTGNSCAECLISLRTSKSADGNVVAEISDTGPGIHASEADRLFEAFFTTKDEGMGMGLSICRSIIEAHGGRIWVVDKPMPGATLRFSLPTIASE